MSKVKITQVKSSIDRSKDQKATLIALGLKKMNQSREIELNPALEGMINKVNLFFEVDCGQAMQFRAIGVIEVLMKRKKIRWIIKIYF